MALKSKTRVMRDAGSGMAFDRLLEEEGCAAHDMEVALIVDPGMSLLAVDEDGVELLGGQAVGVGSDAEHLAAHISGQAERGVFRPRDGRGVVEGNGGALDEVKCRRALHRESAKRAAGRTAEANGAGA